MKKNIYFLVCLSLVFSSMLFLPFYSKAVTCQNNCSGSDHGSCFYSDGSCSCVYKWIGSDCSILRCPPNNCSDGNGYCLSDGSCDCRFGWTGSDCSSPISTSSSTGGISTTSSCPNNCSGNGNCNSGSCSCDAGWTGSDCSVSTSSAPSTPQEEAIQAVQDNIQNAVELDNQALQKIKEGDYPSLVPIIYNAAESLTNARDGIMHLELTVDAEIKIDRLLQSAIKNHQKISSTVDRIVNDPKVQEDEGLLSRLLKKTKKFIHESLINDRRMQHEITNYTSSVRG